MKAVAATLALGILILLASVPTEARSQVIENGNLTGKVVSKALLEGSAYTVPATGHLIITQLCLTPITLGNSATTVPRLVGSVSGTLYSTLAMSNGTTTANVVAADSCVRWTPGFAVQQGESLTCTGGSMATNETCAFTGVLTDR